MDLTYRQNRVGKGLFSTQREHRGGNPNSSLRVLKRVGAAISYILWLIMATFLREEWSI